VRAADRSAKIIMLVITPKASKSAVNWSLRSTALSALFGERERRERERKRERVHYENLVRKLLQKSVPCPRPTGKFREWDI
jgi:hypothetical protein